MDSGFLIVFKQGPAFARKLIAIRDYDATCPPVSRRVRSDQPFPSEVARYAQYFSMMNQPSVERFSQGILIFCRNYNSCLFE